KRRRRTGEPDVDGIHSQLRWEGLPGHGLTNLRYGVTDADQCLGCACHPEKGRQGRRDPATCCVPGWEGLDDHDEGYGCERTNGYRCGRIREAVARVTVGCGRRVRLAGERGGPSGTASRARIGYVRRRDCGRRRPAI